MSGPRDTRETAETAGTAAAPAAPAPPSFGAVPPAGGTAGTEAAPASRAPFEEAAAASADEAAPSSLRLPAFGLQAPWWAAEPAAEPTGGDPAGPAAAGSGAPVGTAPPGTLVAGAGVPNVDSRRAVPSEPIVDRPLAFGDTDPDGFAAVRPDEDPAPTGTEAPNPTTTTGPMGIAPPVPAKAAPAAETQPTLKTQPAEKAQPAAVPESAPPQPAATDASAAFEEAMVAEQTPAPILVPDAILPPGVLPPTGSGPFPHSGGDDAATAATAEQPAMAAVITPVYHAEGGVPLDAPGPADPGGPAGPAAPGQPRPGAGRRRLVLVGGGAAVVLAALVALFAVGGTGSKGDGATRKDAGPSHVAAPPPAANTPPKPKPVDINDERTDPKDLSFTEAFPDPSVDLGERTFDRDRWSINKDLAYAARGTMLKALQQEKCRKVVRATFINQMKTWAVTTGIAVMPNRAAALRASRAGDPGKYEWFRGMSGEQAKDIDRAGGYAAATVRGRYVIYAYVQDPSGKQVKPGNVQAKQIAQQFLGYSARPIEARAHG
ncbi:hypothetical protein [Actinomadura opuntiae]|uniref:hypothetical protein n=1 Tax=Actinomadura sp. OS1-43 TaxID=604315 RepID=UPI00255AA434|nr:hypothetical protein [Actinomadura sp. OS1-43]MDL4821641.1 hypothetical protein [Actinomadura sp. OS1-43]